MAFLEGYGIGLGMIIFIGPVFFTLLKSTLQNGFWPGMMVAWGIFISDVVCVLLCSFGAIPFFKNPDNQFWLAILGSLVLFGLGLKYILKPSLNLAKTISFKARHFTTYFTKGFLVNFVNPFVFLVWIGVIGYGRGKYGYSTDLASFLGASLLGILTTDSLKVVFANKIKVLVQPQNLVWAYRIIGALLIGFGIRMLWFVF